MNDKYILKRHKAIVEPDLLKWGKWFETANRRVAEDTVGRVHISTVFLGLDHSFGDRRKPLVFETMVFGGESDGEQQRYCSWEEAEQGHKKMVEKITPQTNRRIDGEV